MATEDRRAERYRFAGMLVPLLGFGCIIIAGLVVLGMADLAYDTITGHRLFAADTQTASPAS